MQIVSQKNGVVEKILRDAQGRLVRATFCVYEQNGRIKARLLHAVFIEEKSLQSTIFTLPGFVKYLIVNTVDFSAKNYISPFIQGSSLYFFGSKPRAPSFV